VSAPLLELRGVTRRFGRTTALDSVDLDLAPGEILVVLGPTGAGKTTLLRTICGLEAPDAGTLFMEGRDLALLAPSERDVALVFQNFSLYPEWTVRRNLEFPLRAPGRALPETEIRERVLRAAETLRIEALLDRPARRLSGGEMQRVAIGRAIVRKPRLFLMDEPLSNLDAKLREALRVELAVLVRSLGVPLVYVTHDQGEALSMADRIAVLVAGRVHQVGTPREVYDRPASPLVAGQLGAPRINLFEARAANGECRAADGTYLCPAAAGLAGPARVGVRPEHLELSPAGAQGSPAVVELVEQSGPEQVLVAHWAGRRVHVLTDRSREFRVGDRVGLAVAEGRAVVWPERGGEAAAAS
jgi:multiple sugar transport system ATP-binding protein